MTIIARTYSPIRLVVFAPFPCRLVEAGCFGQPERLIMKIGDRVKFTAESILWLYYKDLWPDSVGVVERELPAKSTATTCVDVRFADGTLVPNEPKAHFKPA